MLKHGGINAFIDSENLWSGEPVGPALCKAIESSKISIPIFSENYADSKWCLRELAQIVQCYRSGGQMVLPIFFYIEPSQVRNQTGSFGKAFQEHENKFEPHVVESWREALRLVGSLKGEVLDKNKVQAEVAKLVIKRVLDELNSRTQFAVCKYQIGIDSQVNDLLTLLNIVSTNTLFVGICGLGGSGKTTIAKAVYNRIRFSFKRHSFLSDVRERATQSMGLLALQKQLLKDIFKEEFDMADYHRGKKLIEGRLRKENVLLVLDDVDQKEQVDALAGDLNWFGKGSRVIITTRDEHILNVAKVDKDKVYWSKLLDPKQSLQLFSLHAFSRDQPPESYMKLSRDVSLYSGGLPLTLEVLGSYLSVEKRQKMWKNTLQKLKKIPDKEVQRRLKISFDNLEDDDQKAIFLDAACFFTGWEKKAVMSVWKACGHCPEAAIETLIKRSLLKFEGYGGCRLRMHDQIRDMGREIVRSESCKEQGKPSRLWRLDEITEVLEGQEGIDRIRGMILPYGSPGVYLSGERFEKMCNLKFLDVNSTNFTGGCLRLPYALRWFRWINCPRNVLTTNFYHKRLVYLNLSCSDFLEAWDIKPQDEQKFQNLKVLDLSECTALSKSPNFLWFPNLKQLDLGYCESLDKLDESIGQLSQLKILILKFCNLLKTLPTSVGNLESLVKLDLTNTKVEELPESICKLSSLKELILQMNVSLKKLPETFGKLKSLVKLKLTNASGIEVLPDGVGLLEKLEVLDLEYCSELKKLPRSMGRMRCLQNFNANGTKVSKLPDDFSTVSNLVKLKMPSGLQALPADLLHWENLKQLEFCYCIRLDSLPKLPSTLVVLICTYCCSLVHLPDLSRLKNLKTLKLDFCEKLEEIQGLEGTKHLEELLAPKCFTLTQTPWKRVAQGTLLLPDRPSHRDIFSLNANDVIYKGLVLCLVLKFKDSCLCGEGQVTSIELDIYACIRREGRTTKCLHTLRIKDVKFTSGRDIIYIHHFKGFDWFGIPLQGKDSIQILDIHQSETYQHNVPNELTPYFITKKKTKKQKKNHLTVNFWKLLFDNRTNQENPNQCSCTMMVKDFFSWSYIEGNGTAEEQQRSNTTVDFSSCLGFDSVSGVMDREGERILIPSKKPYLLDNHDGTPFFHDEDDKLLSAVRRIILENEEEDGVLRAMQRLQLDEDDNGGVTYLVEEESCRVVVTQFLD